MEMRLLGRQKQDKMVEVENREKGMGNWECDGHLVWKKIDKSPLTFQMT